MKLVVLGLGYSAAEVLREGAGRFDAVTATVRSTHKAETLLASGIEAVVLDEGPAPPALLATIRQADALLVSVPAEQGGDPVVGRIADAVGSAPSLGWIGYLSTVGVYGDHAGAVVDETAPLRATSPRALNRIAAERAWLDLGASAGLAVQVFRLAGIYGPGRNPLQAMADGSARRIVKPGQVFSRIHVEDIARACLASLDRPDPGAIYNIADNEPAAPQDVVAYAAALLGLPPPPEEPFETAILSPMARSFYADRRRISNLRMRTDLACEPRYPTYREGLAALFEAGEGR
jgi:nucleoside-diphosphate-sugar epimerase